MTIEIIQTIALLFIIGVLVYQKKGLPGKTKSEERMILDSCALIDGRVLEIAHAGFTPNVVVVPRFILSELQLLADGSDSHKRERARFGLTIAQELKSVQGIEVIIDDDLQQAITKTDDKLLSLAKKYNGLLCTTDYNLNKVATVEGVRVLNVNELSNAVRPAVLPGEKREIKIVQKGSNRDQGVGYLDDGTMVVVAGGGSLVGKTMTVEVTRMLQTEAGKMLFAQKIKGSSRN